MPQSEKLKPINYDTFESIVIKKKEPSVLIFGAEWSGNSAMIDSMMQRVSNEFNYGVHFFSVDIEEQAEISKFYGVSVVPTIVIMKEGEVLDYIKGFISASKVRKKINKFFSDVTDG